MNSDKKEQTKASGSKTEALAPTDAAAASVDDSWFAPEPGAEASAPADTEMAGEEVPAGTEKAAKKAPPPAASRGGVPGWFVVLALVVLLAGGAYYWEQNVFQMHLAVLGEQVAVVDGAQAAVQAAVDAKMDSAAGEVATVAAEIAALRSKIGSTVAAQSDLQRSVSGLYKREAQTSIDWILAEAEYLVFAATQRLALERDVETAIAALRAADHGLRSAEHPDLIPIRNQIIQDVSALEAVNLPDIEGLAIYLAKTIGQVDELPTKPIANEAAAFGTVRSGGQYEAEDWRRLAHTLWSDLIDLVEVKDAVLPDSVLFDPELRYFLRQNLKLELASARLAVLRRDKANLDASAVLIKGLLDTYYDVDDAGVANIVKRLDEATTLELIPALPNTARSLDMIRRHRDSRTADKGLAR